MDELGRATSTADGIGIACAVSEHLIGLGQPPANPASSTASMSRRFHDLLQGQCYSHGVAFCYMQVS